MNESGFQKDMIEAVRAEKQENDQERLWGYGYSIFQCVIAILACWANQLLILGIFMVAFMCFGILLFVLNLLHYMRTYHPKENPNEQSHRRNENNSR